MKLNAFMTLNKLKMLIEVILRLQGIVAVQVNQRYLTLVMFNHLS